MVQRENILFFQDWQSILTKTPPIICISPAQQRVPTGSLETRPTVLCVWQLCRCCAGQALAGQVNNLHSVQVVTLGGAAGDEELVQGSRIYGRK